MLHVLFSFLFVFVYVGSLLNVLRAASFMCAVIKTWLVELMISICIVSLVIDVMSVIMSSEKQ